MGSEEAFGEVFRTVRVGQAEGVELSEQVRREFAGGPDAEVLETWSHTFEAMVDRFRTAPYPSLFWRC